MSELTDTENTLLLVAIMARRLQSETLDTESVGDFIEHKLRAVMGRHYPRAVEALDEWIDQNEEQNDETE